MTTHGGRRAGAGRPKKASRARDLEIKRLDARLTELEREASNLRILAFSGGTNLIGHAVDAEIALLKARLKQQCEGKP